MSGAHRNGGTPPEFFTRIKTVGLEVSCVAPNPFEAGFSFGTDDGEVKFTDETGTLLREMKGSPSEEAINGIASFGNSIAVSSRQEVMLRTWTPAHPNRLAVFGPLHGAHGVSATPSGFYIAPLGQTGIMMMKADSGHGDPVGVMIADKESMYFYRVLARKGRNGKDLLICAARHGGIGIAEVLWGDPVYNMRTATFPGLDAVDVCFVGGEPESLALAAVGRDGSLILARDMLHDEKPLTMKFGTIQGRAYRLLSARGHLFLLTSSGLYGLMNLGTRLMQGLPFGKFTTPILVMPMEAVDASLIGERWLPVVLPDEVLRLDLDLIHDNVPQDLRDGEIREATVEAVESAWEFDDIKAGAKALAGVS